MAKVCSKCGIEKDESEFYKKSQMKDGLFSYCTTCHNMQTASYYRINKDKVCNRQAAYYKDNAENKKTYRKARAEKSKVYQRSYYLNNKERLDSNNKGYYKVNKDKIMQQKMAHDKQRMLVDSMFKLVKQTRSLLRCSLSRKGYSKKSKTADLLGCAFESFMEHLGPIPCDNPHLDHICPISQAKTEEEVNKLQSYVNFQWLTPEDNIRKSDNQTEEGLFMCRFLLGREWIYG